MVFADDDVVVGFAGQGFVGFGAADLDVVVSSFDSVGEVGGPTGPGADGVQLRHVFGMGQQQGQGAEGTPEVIQVESGDDHADARIGEPVADVDDHNVRHAA